MGEGMVALLHVTNILRKVEWKIFDMPWVSMVGAGRGLGSVSRQLFYLN